MIAIRARRADAFRPPRLNLPLVLLVATLVEIWVATQITVGSRKGILLVFAPIGLLLMNRFPQASLMMLIAALLFDAQFPAASASKLLPLAIAGIWIFGLLLRRWALVPVFHAPLMVFAILIALSVSLSPKGYSIVSPRSDALSLLGGVVLCAAAASFRPSVTGVLRTIGAVGTLTALIMLSGAAAAIAHTAEQGAGVDRISALGIPPNGLAILLAAGGVALVGLAVESRNPFLAAGLVPIVLALPTIKSRSAILDLAVGLVVVLFGRRRLTTRTAVVLALLLTFLFVPQAFRNTYRFALGARAANTTELATSTQARRSAAKLAWHEGIRHPLLGIGYGNLPGRALADPNTHSFLNAHNNYLRLFAETGVPTVLCLLLVIGVAMVSTRRHPMRTAAVAVLVTYAFAMASADYLSILPITSGFWVLLGTAAGAGALRRSSTPAVVSSTENALTAAGPS